jgi:DNA-binding IclR family transcriptional regulator
VILNNIEGKRATAPDRQRGVDRVIDIFEDLLRSRQPVKIGDLTRRLGAPRSTLYNLVNRLVAAELLELREDGSVFFGRAMHLCGVAYAEANPLQRQAREMLDELAAKADATAQFCALRGAKYVVLDSRNGRGLFRITGEVGVPVPLPWTASGRLLLDHLTPQQILDLIPPEDYVLPSGRTVERAAFLDDVARARADGFCITNGLSDHFACCLAAPIRDADARAVATLCFVTSVHASEARRRELMAMLIDGAERLAASARGGAVKTAPASSVGD